MPARRKKEVEGHARGPAGPDRAAGAAFWARKAAKGCGEAAVKGGA